MREIGSAVPGGSGRMPSNGGVFKCKGINGNRDLF
jgi:hypothetical protein